MTIMSLKQLVANDEAWLGYTTGLRELLVVATRFAEAEDAGDAEIAVSFPVSELHDRLLEMAALLDLQGAALTTIAASNAIIMEAA